jgi:hypothetical protein
LVGPAASAQHPLYAAHDGFAATSEGIRELPYSGAWSDGTTEQLQTTACVGAEKGKENDTGRLGTPDDEAAIDLLAVDVKVKSSWVSARDLQMTWCERGDSNPHGFTRQILSLVRLPIPPLSLRLNSIACEQQKPNHSRR